MKFRVTKERQKGDILSIRKIIEAATIKISVFLIRTKMKKVKLKEKVLIPEAKSKSMELEMDSDLLESFKGGMIGLMDVLH
jgi:hypothetical protein